MAPSPSPAELRELAEKYAALAALRREKDVDQRGTTALQALRALARRFPGCLRELDTLGPAELSRRQNAAAAAAAGGSREPWMDWIWAYHRLMSAALGLKGRLGGKRVLSPEERATLAAEITRAADLEIDEAFVQAVARPPQRRLGVVVLERVGLLFSTSPRTVAEALFPVRRPSPYELP